MKRASFSIMFAALTLLGLGLIILMSASSVYSIRTKENLFAIFIAQLFKGGIGITLMFMMWAIPYYHWKKYSKAAILVIVVILILTLTVMPARNNVHRWFFMFQPAEVAKLVLIIHLARLLEDKREFLNDFWRGYAYPLFWMLIIAGLVVVQPSLSNTLIILTVSFFMMMLGGVRWKYLSATFLAGALPVAFAVFFFDYIQKRIMVHYHSIMTGEYTSYQVQQAIIGLGSGGIFGLGIGNSQQRNFHLPEAYGDFIFAIVGEEIGIIGSVLVVLLFVTLFILGIVIARQTKDNFGQLLAFGISLSIFMHMIIHVSVSLGLIPSTGIPLPFVSHGGTSLITIFISLGILMNIGFCNEKAAAESEEDELNEK